MAYPQDIVHMAIVDPTTPQSLTSAAVIKRYLAGEGFQVRRVGFFVTTAPTVTAAVIQFQLRPTPGSATNAVVLATLNIPVGQTIGTTVYANLDSVKISLGQELAAVVTTTSTAGAGVVEIGAYLQDEQPQNVSSYVLST